MRLIKITFIIILSIYSLALILVELLISQDYARHYFTDITGPVPLYAVNTTLSSFLLWAVALLFTVNLSFLNEDDINSKEHIFYVSQVWLFCLLGLDDRFKLHEWLGSLLGINDAYLILGLAIVEIIILLFLGNLKNRSRRTKLSLFIAAVFFTLMFLADAFLPSRMILRLSCEDLSKTWSALCLLVFAWEICNSHITKLKQRAEAA